MAGVEVQFACGQQDDGTSEIVMVSGVVSFKFLSLKKMVSGVV